MPTGSPLRIGIDARCLNTPHLRGMGKYVIELITRTNRLTNIEWRFFADRPDTIFHKPLEIDGKVDLFDFKGYRFHTWEQIGLPWRSQRAGMHVLHCTATTLPYWQPVPTIVTIHDALPWHDTELQPYEKWYWHRLIPAAFRKCAAVITISESSRRDVLNLWPNLEHKLHVIPHGISNIYLNAQRKAFSPLLFDAVGTNPYLLYIGGSLERKRFFWAIRILAHLNISKLRLLACGFSEVEREQTRHKVERSLRDRIVFLPFIEEDDMAHLYQQAVAVLYPTLYEGFGFPALEAQAVGTPVLFSALGSLSELAGPAAEILPPDDLDSWLQTCLRLFSQRSESQIPNEAARQWARQFSWEASAARHLELYQRATKPDRSII
ncbi:MAG: glycosyltransferase family 4 protein [Candidatus Competibacteraceae bacterium]|nr:glycosyltransferase family 4 protein [Candidatus Competibacteraceae bacterium]